MVINVNSDMRAILSCLFGLSPFGAVLVAYVLRFIVFPLSDTSLTYTSLSTSILHSITTILLTVANVRTIPESAARRGYLDRGFGHHRFYLVSLQFTLS